MAIFQDLNFYHDSGRTVRRREREAGVGFRLPEGLHLDGLFVALPTQLADPLGGLLQHLLSCLFLMEVKFGLSCLKQQHWMNKMFIYFWF